MEVTQFVQQLRKEIVELKSDGTNSIACENLISYLDETLLSSEPSDKAFQLLIEDKNNIHASQLEMFRSVIAAGQNAIRSSFLLNGGASVTLLAFIGHLAEINPSKVEVFSNALIPFVIGVLAITMTSGLTYLTQWLYSSKRQKIGDRCNIIAIIFGLLSYGTFIWGMFCAYNGFSSFVLKT